jgi:hypothetical protein
MNHLFIFLFVFILIIFLLFEIKGSRGFFIARKMLRRRHIMKERREKRELEERKRKMSKE